MKKILEMFGEPISYGGQESVVYNMLSIFDLKNEFKVDLFTPYFADNKELMSLVENNGGKVHALGIEFKTFDNRLLLEKPVKEFFKNIEKYDVAHIHTGSLATMYVYAKVAKKYSVKNVIVHSHIAGYNGKLKNKIRRFILCQYLKKYVNVYMGCSKAAIDAKFIKSIQKNPIVVNNGIDINKFRFNNDYRKEIRDKYNINDKFVIGSLGRINYQKNNIFMIDILKLIEDKNVVLMMVGTGDDYQKVKEYADKVGISDRVIFTGNQTETEKYYSAFDIFILPSLFEGLPVTAIEAQVSSLPSLISINVDHSVFISNGACFLPIGDANVWAKMILDIKENKNGRYDRDKFCIDFDKFDRDKTFEKVKEIYKKYFMDL